MGLAFRFGLRRCRAFLLCAISLEIRVKVILLPPGLKDSPKSSSKLQSRIWVVIRIQHLLLPPYLEQGAVVHFARALGFSIWASLVLDSRPHQFPKAAVEHPKNTQKPASNPTTFYRQTDHPKTRFLPEMPGEEEASRAARGPPCYIVRGR